MKEDILTFSEGGMWDKNEWEIYFDDEIGAYSDVVPCKHCSEIREKENTRYDGSIYYTTVFTCPSVVVAKNEGGYASTGVCLQCIIEASESIEEE